MPICAPCRSTWHEGCLADNCPCQHRPTPIAPEPSGTDGTTTLSESESR